MLNHLPAVFLVLAMAGCGARTSLPDGDVAAEASACGSLGAPEVLFANRNLPDSLALGDQYLYWIEEQSYKDTVWRVSTQGGDTPKQIFAGEALHWPLVIGTDLYMFTLNTLVKMPADGGEVVKLANIPGPNNDAGSPEGLVADNDALYWLESGDSFSPASSLKKLALAGGAPTVLANWSMYVFDLALSGDSVFWVNQSPMQGPNAMGGVRRTPKNGTGSTSVFSGINPSVVATNADGVYWSAGLPGDKYPSAIWWMSFADNAPRPVVKGGLWYDQLVPREECLYFVLVDSMNEGGPVRIGRTPLAGGTPLWLGTALRSYQHRVRAVFDDSYVYWNDPLKGQILRLRHDKR